MKGMIRTIAQKWRRRGFALPLVVVMAVVLAVVVVGIMERQGGAVRLQQRDLDLYQDHHVSRGLQEAVQAWLRTLGQRGVASGLEADGRAFDVEVDGAVAASVRFEEAQSTVLADFAGLPPEDAILAATVVNELRQRAPDIAPRLIRREGPLAVSVKSAREVVLRSVIAACGVGEDDADRLMDRLVRERETAEFDQIKLGEIIAGTELTSEVKVRLGRMLSADPVLWWVVAEAPTTDGRPIRYRGLTIVPNATQRRLSAGVQRMSSILSWERDDLPDTPAR